MLPFDKLGKAMTPYYDALTPQYANQSRTSCSANELMIVRLHSPDVGSKSPDRRPEYMDFSSDSEAAMTKYQGKFAFS